jgi:hypothetical protein
MDERLKRFFTQSKSSTIEARNDSTPTQRSLKNRNKVTQTNLRNSNKNQEVTSVLSQKVVHKAKKLSLVLPQKVEKT